MITERTKNVLIESAWFDPATVRSMAKRHCMHTDASHRFERGADWGITPLACDRVAELILAERRRRVARRTDRHCRPQAGARDPSLLHRSEVNRILGIDLERDEIAAHPGRSRLSASTGRASRQDGSTSASRFPPGVSTSSARSICWKSWRASTATTSFPTRCRAFVGAVVTLPDEPKNAKVRETMLALGYDESHLDHLHLRAGGEDLRKSHPRNGLGGAPGEPLAIANPLSEEAGYLRTSLLPGLLNMVGYNLNRGNTNVRLFEAGEVFEKLRRRPRRAPPPGLCRDRRCHRQERPLRRRSRTRSST